MKKIRLTKNKFAFVDDADFELVSKYRWHAAWNAGVNNFYAKSSTIINDKKIWILMHRIIMNLKYKDGKQIDHINHDTLDNRRSNLRIATCQQNSANKMARKGTSVYKGVSWVKKEKKWRAGVKHNQKYIYLGDFKSEIKAALAYDEKAKELFGEFATLNFPKEKK